MKVDYTLFSADKSTVYFVELKTDQYSRNATQDEYLIEAQSIGFEQLLGGVKQIVLHSNQVQKYFHLLTALAKEGVIGLPKNAEERDYIIQIHRKKRGVLESISIPAGERRIAIWDIQLVGHKSHISVITFDDILNFLKHKSDSLNGLFGTYLERWKEQAGEIPLSKL